MRAVSPLLSIRITSLPRPLSIPAQSLPAIAAAVALLASSCAVARDHDDLGTAARAILGANQGVYVEAADGEILLAQAARLPVHPASVSKVPTTLALLHRLGPDYRFTTTFSGTGAVHDGLLEGDLIVDGGGDPFFVDENALLVAARLNELGVRRVAGTLRVRGTLIFNWQGEAAEARLRAVLSGQAPPSAVEAVNALAGASSEASKSTPAALQFEAKALAPAAGTADPVAARPLIAHRSQPLLSLVKALNDYSNNVFKPLADAAGGAATVQELARSQLPASMRTEITLGDGAGTDPRNRLSPRAAVRILRALEQELRLTGHSLVDALPVAGFDPGTLQERLNAAGESGCVVGKTGTFGEYGASALIGALRSRDHGTVYFAILNHGVPVPEARRRQDQLLRVLFERLHVMPWAYQRDTRPAVALAEADPVIMAAP
jgi:D-alanyl-D-alanine carboxypeptidase/D-alanyl-D-alanine-endopeptidase (penicillin-binding protein 4)